MGGIEGKVTRINSEDHGVINKLLLVILCF